MKLTKLSVCLVISTSLSCSLASPGPGIVPGLDGSMLSTLSGLVIVSAPIISPLLVIESIDKSVDESNTVKVVGKNEDGSKVEMNLPKSIADKAQLKVGDQITAEPHPSGALLKKGDVALAFAVKPELSGISSNQELQAPTP
ncbi:STM0539 family protein [Leeia sp. TBRC 13508]|uniref:STM0539 family protein n=1 Tax=Leeia speluncae TaxID=2884804 RepID=A0ABS8D724_9NEIS|nr:STM0539 family protein [Leeia speluncae]MCB6183994.1 STM0539 family protein [Leeia speluncae]